MKICFESKNVVIVSCLYLYPKLYVTRKAYIRIQSVRYKSLPKHSNYGLFVQ